MILHQTCKTCQRTIKGIQSEIPKGGFTIYVWNPCGHIEFVPVGNIGFRNNPVPPVYAVEDIKVPPETKEELLDNLDRWVSDGGLVRVPPDILKEIEEDEARHKFKSNPIWKSLDGSLETYEFQKTGVDFAEKAQLKCLIGDAPGVGKTIQALMCIKRNEMIATPCLYIVSSAILFQWVKEYNRWVGRGIGSIMPIMQRHNIIPGFKNYIISRDLLSKKGVLELVLKLNLKCIVIDEVQRFKDPSSDRTKALISLIEQGNIEYKIALSGTPIKNRVGEYFTILNILDPLHFPSRADFNKYWLTTNAKGKLTRLNPYRAEEFFKITGKYIIRREKRDVLKNLPPLVRDFQLIDIQDPSLKNSYNRALGMFDNFLNNSAGIDQKQILGWLAKLRAITGVGKVAYAVEWIEDFLESTEDSIIVGIQHDDVRETIYEAFKAKGYSPLSLSGKDSAWEKTRLQNDFNNGKNRILIINMLAGGEGLNLQSASNMLVLERQWNRADEEQFEGRIERDGQKNNMTVTYPLAKGTLDEWFHDMIFSKQSDIASAGVGKESEESNNLDSMLEFAQFVAANKI